MRDTRIRRRSTAPTSVTAKLELSLERLKNAPVAYLLMRGARLHCENFDVHSHAFVQAPCPIASPWPARSALLGDLTVSDGFVGRDP